MNIEKHQRVPVKNVLKRYSTAARKAALSLKILAISTILTSAAAMAESQSCFSSVNLEPSFIAFTAESNSQLGNWYQKTFDLEVAKEFTVPNGGATGVLMYKDEFIVEVFYRDDAVTKREIAPDYRSAQWTGIQKFGVYSDADLPPLKQCLTEKGVNAGRIFRDELLKIDLLLVTDPDQNIIEIIQRHEAAGSSD